MKNLFEPKTLLEIKQYGIKIDLPKLSQLDFQNIPCIYFLLNEESIVYIGQTTEPERRICAHKMAALFKFNNAYYLKCEDRLLCATEKKYIQRFQPPNNLNLTHKTVRKSVSFRMDGQIFIKLKLYAIKRRIPYSTVLDVVIDEFISNPNSFPTINFLKYK